jgi:hypothetical protein
MICRLKILPYELKLIPYNYELTMNMGSKLQPIATSNTGQKRESFTCGKKSGSDGSLLN